jgi:hypothetical protein
MSFDALCTILCGKSTRKFCVICQKGKKLLRNFEGPPAPLLPTSRPLSPYFPPSHPPNSHPLSPFSPSPFPLFPAPFPMHYFPPPSPYFSPLSPYFTPPFPLFPAPFPPFPAPFPPTPLLPHATALSQRNNVMYRNYTV